MPKKLNLINQKFGRLVVLESAPNCGKRTAWRCLCECGKETVKTTDSLRSGRAQSCGCLQAEAARKNGMKQLKDLKGQRFGQLIVIDYAGSARGRSVWLCKCTCGNYVNVNQMELVKGDTLSCGCLRSSFGEKRIEQLLIELNLIYKKEYSFSDLCSENNIPLRFDFAIFDENHTCIGLIEYDGEQHYSDKTDAIWTDTLNKRQQRDKIKNQYCLKYNIPLYRIPYWDKNNITKETLFNKKYLIQIQEKEYE